jgi:hypothetical protein
MGWQTPVAKANTDVLSCKSDRLFRSDVFVVFVVVVDGNWL